MFSMLLDLLLLLPLVLLPAVVLLLLLPALLLPILPLLLSVCRSSVQTLLACTPPTAKVMYWLTVLSNSSRWSGRMLTWLWGQGQLHQRWVSAHLHVDTWGKCHVSVLGQGCGLRAGGQCLGHTDANFIQRKAELHYHHLGQQQSVTAHNQFDALQHMLHLQRNAP
jgi:hypothetical protein